MTFVDTNYFLRFLLNDVSAQHDEAVALFKLGAEDKSDLCTSVIVFFELFWVFSSFYQKPKLEVVAILKSVLSLRFIHIDQREILEKTLLLYEVHNIEFEDCYNLVFAMENEVENFKTFDKKLLKVVRQVLK